MAKTRSRTQRKAPRPRPVPRGVTGGPAAGAVSVDIAAVGEPVAEDWAEMYPYVRGDLIRIVALSSVLFILIFAAPYVL